MKKRTLSFVMALCMVLLALPFAAFPMVAAEKESFTTRFAGNEPTWPTYESGVAFKRFNGNWSMGYFDGGVYRQHYDFAKGNNIVTTGEAWQNTGIFLESGQIILTEGIGGGDANAFYELSTFKGNPVTEDKVNKVAGVMTYTAPYTGTVELDVTNIFGVDRQLNNIEGVTKETYIYFAIFVNGKMVWPNAGDYYSQPSKWALISNKDEFNEKREATGGAIKVDVTSRDKIQFAVALAPRCTSYAFMQPTVAYDAGYTVVPEKVTQSFDSTDHYWPELGVLNGEELPLEQPSEVWQMGAFDKATGTFTPYTQYSKLNNGSGYAHGELAATDSAKPWIKNGGILLDFPNKAFIGAMSKPQAENIRAAYAKTSIANGKLTVNLDGIALANATGDAAKNATANLVVYVNGTQKASAQIKTEASGKVTFTAPTVDVARGDKIVIAADNFDAATAFVAGTPVVTYSNIASFMNGTATSENEIALEMVNVKVNGSIDLVLNAYGTRNVYENATAVTLYLWDKDVTGEKTPANATVTLPMEMNTELFSYEAMYNDFAIKELADDMTVQVVAMNGDAILCQSAQTTLNAADVAYADYEAAEGKMKTLYANLLNYAAYAQIYFDYNTENLANANLPAELKALDYDMLYDAQFEAIKPTGSLQVSDSEIGSFSLILDNTIALRTYIHVWETERFDTNKFYIQYGETLADCYNDERRAATNAGDNKYSYTIPEIGAHEMGKLHYVRAVVTYRRQIGEGFREFAYYGYAMSYSVESYASRMLESTEPGLEDLVRAMMEFGKAAAAVY